MQTQAPEITVDATVGQVVVSSPAPTPTLSPAGPPMSPPYYPVATTAPVYTYPTLLPVIPKPKNYKSFALTIYGFGPANSEVTLRGFGVSEKTISDSTGLFRFSEIYSFTHTYPELCIQAVDDLRRVTQPSCIPALPSTNLIPLEVGPILLSPTITVTENKVKEGSEAKLFGKTTPNTKVNIYISKKGGGPNKISFVKEASAYTLPVLDVKSNEKGEYEVSLPTNDSAEYKIFASTKFGDSPSAKSTTLTFAVVTKLKTFLERLWDFILQNKMTLFILFEVIFFVILFGLALKSTTKSKKRHNEMDYLESLKLFK